MSLYNMVNKVNPAAFFLLPMLYNKHPDQWPRFRDCFATPHNFQMINDLPMMVAIDEKRKPDGIYPLLRIGGGNRSDYNKEIEEIRSHPNYLDDEDDEMDNTYAHFAFSIPENWRDDYDKVIAGDMANTSQEYKNLIIGVFPKLNHVLVPLFNS